MGAGELGTLRHRSAGHAPAEMRALGWRRERHGTYGTAPYCPIGRGGIRSMERVVVSREPGKGRKRRRIIQGGEPYAWRSSSFRPAPYQTTSVSPSRARARTLLPLEACTCPAGDWPRRHHRRHHADLAPRQGKRSRLPLVCFGLDLASLHDWCVGGRARVGPGREWRPHELSEHALSTLV